MAENKKISELPEKTTVHDNDEFVLVDSEESEEDDKTKKVGGSNLKSQVGAHLAHASRHQKSGADEMSLSGMSGDEIRLVPKASSTGAEGTVFYNSGDDHVYVATE